VISRSQVAHNLLAKFGDFGKKPVLNSEQKEHELAKLLYAPIDITSKQIKHHTQVIMNKTNIEKNYRVGIEDYQDIQMS
jgi:hypothetical protein